jgi:penicillin-binding protein 2
MLLVFLRAVQLEVTQGSAFRAEASRPLRAQTSLPAVRGRILARDGTVLACDQELPALAVHYRYLQQPPDPSWLWATARSRLSPAQRKDALRVAAEEAQLRAERRALTRRLARLCGVSPAELDARARRVQARVERIAESVNRRRRSRMSPPEPPATSSTARLAQLLREMLDGSTEERPRERITVAEERDYHVLIEELPPDAVAEIEEHAERYPGVKIVTHRCRVYPAGPLAAHVLGYLGPVEPQELSRDREGAYQPEDFVGRAGVERQYESLLRGRRGSSVELTDHSGRVLESYQEQPPQAGRDLVLTIDPPLQRAAEQLLASALERRAMRQVQAEPAGGAIVVLDVRTGALWAAGAAPQFDPRVFTGGEAQQRAALLDDPAHPLFDRVCQMALPPGSVFKVVSAVALMESAALDPEEAFVCQGYLHQPDRQRCAIFVRHGVGHGKLTLQDALAQSCNVYFFHHCGRLGPEPLIAWAQQFGFGRTTGVDLPGEVAGTLPSPETIGRLEGRAWQPGDTQALAIGQGLLTATPLQVACLMAAVANGGRLVRPHVVSRVGSALQAGEPRLGEDDLLPARPAQPVAGLKPETLAVVREGLRRVVCDPRGTAHGTVDVDSVAIAAKTGTAQAGDGRAAHAWLAGYVPADRPKFAFVVVLEQCGDAATAAGPVAKRLVLKMQKLALL